MGIQEKLDYLEDTKQAIKQAIIDKGVEVSETDTFRSYANKVGEISSSGGSFYGVTFTDLFGEVDESGKLNSSTNQANLVFDGINDIGDYVFYQKYVYNKTFPYSVSFPDLIKVTGKYACSYMCNYNKVVTEIDLKNLTSVDGDYSCESMFANCENITSVDLSGLKYIKGLRGCSNMFQQCSSLESVNLSNLESITSQMGCNYMFSQCKNLKILTFNSLRKVTGYRGLCGMLRYSGVETVNFPSLTSNDTEYSIISSAFYGLLDGVTGCTVHFPSNLESVISSWSDVVGGFGGTNTVVLFDLLATE